MVPVNDYSERLIEAVGKATPVVWYEVDSGIRFKCSYCDFLEALFEVNRELALKRYVTLENFISLFKEGVAIIPNDIDPVMLTCGWSSQCFECWDGYFIDIYYKVSSVDDEPVFETTFMLPYCQDCYDCDGCNLCEAALYREMMRKEDFNETRTY